MVRKNFTLVEILVVLGLMAVLLFIALPAFEKLAKGSGVELAARNLASKLGMARGYAITNRQYVAVLMPTETAKNTTDNIALPNDYLYRGYKLCVVSSTYTTGTPNVFTFKRWLPSEKWEFLPVGTSIVDVDNTLGLTSNLNHENVNAVNLLEIGTSYGTTNPAGNPGKLVDCVRAIVFKPTGKLAVSGLRYVTVGESTYNGAPSPNQLTHTNTQNRLEITIDQFTGRVTYGAE